MFCAVWFEFNGEKGHCQVFKINFQYNNKATRENLFSRYFSFFQSDLQNYFQSMELTVPVANYTLHLIAYISNAFYITFNLTYNRSFNDKQL